MKTIKFNVDEVLGKASLSSSVITKTSMPILEKIWLQTFMMNQATALLLTISDGETWLMQVAPLIEGDALFDCCIDARMLVSSLKNLTGSVVTLELDEEKKVALCKYGSGQFSLPYDSSDAFPPMPQPTGDRKTMVMKGEKLLRNIDWCDYAMENDELRPVMNSIHFDFFPQSVVSVATNGHKLIKLEDKEEGGVDGEISYSITLPQKPSSLLVQLLHGTTSDVTLDFDDKNITFKNGSFKLVSRLLEQRYPNYNSVIPQANDKCVLVDKNTFAKAIKRVIPMSSDITEMLKLTFEQRKLTIEAEDKDYMKSAKEHVECEYNDSGVLMIGFKGSSLLQTVMNIPSEKVRILLSDPNRAALFTPETQGDETWEYTSLLMPMMMN